MRLNKRNVYLRMRKKTVRLWINLHWKRQLTLLEVGGHSRKQWGLARWLFPSGKSAGCLLSVCLL